MPSVGSGGQGEHGGVAAEFADEAVGVQWFDEEEEEEPEQEQDQEEDAQEEDKSMGESESKTETSIGTGQPRSWWAELSQPTTVPVGKKFWHPSCIIRSLCFFVSYWVLMMAGLQLAKHASPSFGLVALTIGPTMVIVLCFFSRYRFSITARQVNITFAEAIVWMIPLLTAVGFIDALNDALTAQDTEVSCVLPDFEGGQRLIWVFSSVAKCSLDAVAAGATNSSGVKHADRDVWNKKLCPQTVVGGSVSGVVVDEDGSFSPGLLDETLRASFDDDEPDSRRRLQPASRRFLPPTSKRRLVIEKDEGEEEEENDDEDRDGPDDGDTDEGDEEDDDHGNNEKHADGLMPGMREAEVKPDEFSLLPEADDDDDGPVCPALDEALQDVVNGGRVRLTSIQRRYSSVSITGREALTEAYMGLCESRATINGELRCGSWGSRRDRVSISVALRRKTVLHAILEAYFRAGFLEELFKYIAVRRVLFKDRVVDCGGLLVYGLAAGAGFATAENIQYTMRGGVTVALTRMFVSIPLHCCTGLIIGIHLGYRKFIGDPVYCLVTLMLPVIIHGTFDFALMLPRSVGLSERFRAAIAVMVLLSGLLYCRCAWLPLDKVCVVDVRKMEREGKISAPRCCCLEPDCCSAWFQHQDPMVEERFKRMSTKEKFSMLSIGASTVGGLAKKGFRALLPPRPHCQTVKVPCPGCLAKVRASILFPSYCPHCAHLMPERVLGRQEDPSDSDEALSRSMED